MKFWMSFLLAWGCWFGSNLALTSSLAQSPPPSSSSGLALIAPEQANKLGITRDQVKAIMQLQKQAHANIESILTPGQLQQFQASLAQGATTRDALQSVDLNIRQKVRVKNVMEGVIAQLKTILTPAQFAAIQTKLQ